MNRKQNSHSKPVLLLTAISVFLALPRISLCRLISLLMLTMLLSACGSQDDASTSIATVNKHLFATNSITKEPVDIAKNGDENLLASLSKLYPDGQLPADRQAQASQYLAQNPAALKLNEQTIPISTSFETKNNISKNDFDPAAVAADYRVVKRVQNTTLYGAYFFSIYPTEITSALTLNPNWRLEGSAFWASLQPGANQSPVHRFRNLNNGSYLYTIYETERDDILRQYAATFTYEGVAWYARKTPATGWSKLYRFRNLVNGTYLFSAYESEKDAILRDYAALFALEGVAYYVRQDAQTDPDIVFNGPVRAIANTLYTYSANVSDASSAVWAWLWGDGSVNNTTNPASKVWYKPGSYTTTVTAIANSVSSTGMQVITVVGQPIGVAGTHTCSLMSDSTINCSGNNFYGQLGDGTTIPRAIPAPVSSMTKFIAISGGKFHTCALGVNGKVYCWGKNNTGELGDGTTIHKSEPTEVAGLSDVTAIATNPWYSCALKADGLISCWGQVPYFSTTKLVPTVVHSLTGVAGITTGSTSYGICALKINGTVSCSGQMLMSDGTSRFILSPTEVLGLTGVAAISNRETNICALKTNGTVSCWGNNFHGQLGDGTTITRPAPTAVMGLSGVSAISTAISHTCALKNIGTVSCWGANYSGQLGDGTRTNRVTPTDVPNLTGVAAISAGDQATCALKTDGSVYCWGSNGLGNLGDGTLTDKLYPSPVLGGAAFWK